jgi:hypothetical protein
MHGVPTSCVRCGATRGAFTTSMFNTDSICLSCKAKEEAHPQYQAAVDAESAAVRSGNFNFRGIGKPADL